NRSANRRAAGAAIHRLECRLNLRTQRQLLLLWYDKPHLRMSLIHPPLGPQVQRPRHALPKHKRNDNERGEEVPPPKACIEVLHRRTLAPAIAVKGVPRNGGLNPELLAM